MVEFAKSFIKTCGASPDVINGIEELKRSILPIPRNAGEAGLHVKKRLLELGFHYDPGVFLVNDVLNFKAGNCLGLPLLFGTLLGELGFNPSYQLIVNPKDKTHQLERLFFDNLSYEMNYDNPRFAKSQDDWPLFRFTPLEHLVLEVEGDGNRYLIETTILDLKDLGSSQDIDSESKREITFNEALSCVYKDRAANEWLNFKSPKAEKLARSGLKLWPNNREIYNLLALIAYDYFDDSKYEEFVNRYGSIGPSDSLHSYNMHRFTGNTTKLETALTSYPEFAGAIASKAVVLTERNSREARFLFALASNCVANSEVSRLSEFYSTYANIMIRKNFLEKGEVLRILKGYASECIGDFDYNMAMYDLTLEQLYLSEAFEAVQTPREHLKFLRANIEANEIPVRELGEMSFQYRNSELFNSAGKRKI